MVSEMVSIVLFVGMSHNVDIKVEEGYQDSY
jgi:hypothetical protein